MSSQGKKGSHCLNCNHPLQGENYCPNCGQKNDTRRMSLANVASETMSNLFALDGRFANTLFLLITQPGQLALDYKEGKRTIYMNPVRLFFLSSLLLLSLLQITDSSQEIFKTTQTPTAAEQDSISSTDDDTDLRIEVPGTDDPQGKFSRMIQYQREHLEVGTEEALINMEYPNTWFNRFLYTQVAKSSSLDDKRFNEYLFSKLFWVLFLYVPFYALLLKLFYFRKKIYYPEHLFYSFYNQSVLFILLSFILPFDLPFWLITPILLYIVYYYIASMKRFYNQGWLITIIKYTAINLLSIPIGILLFAGSAILAFVFFH